MQNFIYLGGSVVKIFLRVLKGVLYALGLTLIVFFIIYFIKGIYTSCVADDIITAQNRIESAYNFLYMVCFGLGAVVCFFSTLPIKEKVITKEEINKIKALIIKK